jgi:hypothetical protein
MELGKPFGTGNYKEVESKSARALEALYKCFLFVSTVRIILVFALTFLLIALIIIRILIFFINILHYIRKFIDFTLLSLVYFLFLSFSLFAQLLLFGRISA